MVTAALLCWALVVEGGGALRNDRLQLLDLFAAAMLVASGALLRRDVGQRRAGLLLWVAAAVKVVADIPNAVRSGYGPSGLLGQPWDSWARQLGYAAGNWAVIPLAFVVLSYPKRELARRWYRWLLCAAALVFVLAPSLESLAYDRHRFNFTGQPYWVTAIPGSETVRVPLLDLAQAGGALVAVLGVAALVSRWRTARGPTRTAVRSIAVVGTVLAIGLAGQGITAELGPDRFDVLSSGWQDVSNAVIQVVLALSPVGLLLEALRHRADRMRILDDLLTAGGNPQAVQQVLAQALEDPGLQLSFAIDGGWVDPAGEDVTDQIAANPVPRRLRHEIAAGDGAPVARVDIAETATADAALLRTVLNAAGVVLDNARLQAALAARLREVATSRARIAEAGLAERRRVERDLHDGAQQQLLAVTATLARAGLSTDATTMRATVDDARTQLAAALSELRRLARGIHPAVLSQGGLPAALPTLADTAPVAVDVDVTLGSSGPRFPPAVESTAWFIAAESVTNAVKHSACSRIAITLHLAGEPAALSQQMVLRISDDGCGTATETVGGGLAALRDRAAAIGGTMTITSAPGNGTTIEAVLPCAS